MDLKERLRAAMNFAGFKTAKELHMAMVEKAGSEVTQQTVSSALTGRSKTTRNPEDYAIACGVSVDFIVGATEKLPKSKASKSGILERELLDDAEYKLLKEVGKCVFLEYTNSSAEITAEKFSEIINLTYERSKKEGVVSKRLIRDLFNLARSS